MVSDKRQFSRLPFETRAQLESESGSLPVRVEDLSLKGVLLTPGGASAVASWR